MLANIPATQTVIQISEVLIRIAAAGVNRADCLQRMGRYPMPPAAPDIPGLESSGTVVKTGDGVSAWRLGDQVCALMIGDGYGEYAAVPAVQCLPVPAGVSLTDAGGLPETFCTVWTNVFERMHLQAGEVFLVQGGSSGIGVTAIQLAKALGGKVEPVTVKCLRWIRPKSVSTLLPPISATKQSRPSCASRLSWRGM